MVQRKDLRGGKNTMKIIKTYLMFKNSLQTGKVIKMTHDSACHEHLTLQSAKKVFQIVCVISLPSDHGK